MSAVLAFLEVPHRARFAPHVQRALALLDRAADGAPVSPPEIERALRLTGDLDGPRLYHPSQSLTIAEGR